VNQLQASFVAVATPSLSVNVWEEKIVNRSGGPLLLVNHKLFNCYVSHIENIA